MLVRIGIVLIVAILLVTEFVPSGTTLASEANWWSYVIRHETGFDRLEKRLSDLRHR